MNEERWVDEFDSLTMTTRCDKPINECAEWHGLCPVGLKDFIRSQIEKARNEGTPMDKSARDGFIHVGFRRGYKKGLERAIYEFRPILQGVLSDYHTEIGNNEDVAIKETNEIIENIKKELKK